MSTSPGSAPTAPIPAHAPLEWLTWATGDDGAKSPQLEHAFVVRNLLIDESVPDWRAVNYGRYLDADGSAVAIDWKTLPDPAATWRIRHGAYFVDRVVRPTPSTGIPGKIDPADDTMCPETFQRIPDSSPFLNANLDIELIRVESLDVVAERAGYPPTDLRAAAEDYLKGRTAAKTVLADILDSYSIRRDLRPAFAGFHADVEDIFASTNIDWADDLRDALGLYGHNPLPPVTGITVLVFKYPIHMVPHLASDIKRRPLVPPTVLDSQPNPAFCPVPEGGLTGHTIHLGQTELALMREVLHPPVPYKPAHLYRMGVIRRPVQVDTLKVSRQWHLEVVRDRSGRSDFASATDS